MYVASSKKNGIVIFTPNFNGFLFILRYLFITHLFIVMSYYLSMYSYFQFSFILYHNYDIINSTRLKYGFVIIEPIRSIITNPFDYTDNITEQTKRNIKS